VAKMRKKWHELNKIYAIVILFLLLCCLEYLPLFCKRFPMLVGLQATSGGNRHSEGNACRFPKQPQPTKQHFRHHGRNDFIEAGGDRA
jgi:hypothetical protein